VSAEPGKSFATLTHARLRASQGDVAGALRILRVILAVQPAHGEARAMVAELETRAPASPRASASARIRRLSAWITRAELNRGSRHVR
jgi:hypothetical protein